MIVDIRNSDRDTDSDYGHGRTYQFDRLKQFQDPNVALALTEEHRLSS